MQAQDAVNPRRGNLRFPLPTLAPLAASPSAVSPLDSVAVKDRTARTPPRKRGGMSWLTVTSWEGILFMDAEYPVPDQLQDFLPDTFMVQFVIGIRKSDTALLAWHERKPSLRRFDRDNAVCGPIQK